MKRSALSAIAFVEIAWSVAIPAQSPATNSESTSKVKAVESRPAVSSAVILTGRFESCIVNPPLSLVTKDGERAASHGDYVLTRTGSNSTALVVAYSAGSQPADRATAFVVDELTVSPSGAISKTGEASKIYRQQASPDRIRLIPSSGDYSVCRYKAPVSSEASSIIRSGTLTAYRPASFTVAAASLWNIFGLDGASSVRLRLSSVPTGAEILVGDLLQAAHTDTVLDIWTADIPHIRLEKPGFEPCLYDQWTTSFERGTKAVLNASCRLRAKRGTPKKN